MAKPDRQSSQPHVVILSQHFHPEYSGTARSLTELAIELQRTGMHVAVITAQPNYYSVERLARRETYRGVEIERLPAPAMNRRKRLPRVVGGLLFAMLVLLRLGLSRSAGPLLIVTNPPFLPFVGWLLKKLRGRQYLCMVHDVYPDMAVRLGFLADGSLTANLWEAVNRAVYLESAGVIVLGEKMAQTVREKIKAKSDGRPAITVVHNWADPGFVVPVPKEQNLFRRQLGLSEKLVVLYSGNMGLYHDMDTLLEAARRLKEEDRIAFVFIGGGARWEQVVDWERRWQLANMHTLPYQPEEALPYSLTCGDISAVTLASGLEGLCHPGKLYTALAAGQAILAIVGKSSEEAEIIERYGCGIRVDQGDVEGVVRALARWCQDPLLLETMKQSARLCFEQHFTVQFAARRYYDILREIRSK
jgi:colanic acid biosynthesis glycosyl transferase WcaI